MKAKTAKEKSYPVHRFEFGADVLELRGVAVRRRQYAFKKDDGSYDTYAEEKNRYEIYFNDLLIGHMRRPNGFGKQPYLVEDVGRPGRSYCDVIYGRGQPYRDAPIYEIPEIVTKIHELRLKKRDWTNISLLPTADELQKHLEAKAKEARKEAALAEERNNAHKAEMKAEKAAKETKRLETLEGLKSAIENHGGRLSNFERNAIQVALEHFSIKPYDYWEDVGKGEC